MNEPNDKAKIRQAQARHQSQLFGGEAQKPSSQAADAHIKQRGSDLTQAAQAKQQRLSTDEAAKLEQLRQRNEVARSKQTQVKRAPAKQAPAKQTQTPAPKQPSVKVKELHEVAQRSDLAAAALENMKRHAQAQAARPTPPPAPAPPPAAEPAPQPPVPAASPSVPAPPTPAPRRAPSPEELDKLLRQMAERARQRPGYGRPAGAAASASSARPAPAGYPRGGEGAPEAAAPVEAAPPPPDAVEREKHTAEQSAEILKELQAKESQAQQDIAPIPQADQTRAKEEAVEARVPIKTEANALSSGPLHDAIAQLQIAMREHDPVGQVGGVNVVHRNMPQHPLYQPPKEPDKPDQSGGTS